jgi:hypothetical protein
MKVHKREIKLAAVFEIEIKSLIYWIRCRSYLGVVNFHFSDRNSFSAKSLKLSSTSKEKKAILFKYWTF